MSNRGCRIVTLPDGTQARVRGDLTPQQLQEIKDALPVLCGHESDVPMPRLAQRVHGRQCYTCALAAGHDGDHYQPVAGAWSNQG